MRWLWRRRAAVEVPVPCSCAGGPTRWGNAGGVQYTCHVCHGAAPGPIRIASVLLPSRGDVCTCDVPGIVFDAKCPHHGLGPR